MLVTLNNKVITFEVSDERKYDVVDGEGKMILKQIFRFVKDNYSDKENILKEIKFAEGIDDELKNGLDFFIKELMNKFKESDLDVDPSL